MLGATLIETLLVFTLHCISKFIICHDQLINYIQCSFLVKSYMQWNWEMWFKFFLTDVDTSDWPDLDSQPLSLEDSGRLRVVSAKVYSIVRNRDKEHFEKVLNFLDDTYRLLPRLVTPIKHMKIVFGLKTMVCEDVEVPFICIEIQHKWVAFLCSQPRHFILYLHRHIWPHLQRALLYTLHQKSWTGGHSYLVRL